LGSVAAPLIVAFMAPRYGWRSTFALCGALGFLWIPLWLFTAKRIPARPAENRSVTTHARDVIRDPRFWGLALANVFVMMLYSLWSNWTTLYFVEERHLTIDQANRDFAWIPPVFRDGRRILRRRRHLPMDSGRRECDPRAHADSAGSPP
jgi:sugar phosphate permease